MSAVKKSASRGFPVKPPWRTASSGIRGWPLVLFMGIVCWYGSVMATHANSGDRNARLFEEAFQAHEAGVKGDSDAVDVALEKFERILESDPENMEALVFFGSASTLKARDVGIFQRMRWVRQGVEAMDRAFETAPNNISVRIVRAVNSYQLPAFLGRRKVADEDFRLLLEWTETRPEKFDPGMIRFTLYHAGVHALEQGQPQAVALLAQALDQRRGETITDQEIQSVLERAKIRFGESS